MKKKVLQNIVAVMSWQVQVTDSEDSQHDCNTADWDVKP